MGQLPLLILQWVKDQYLKCGTLPRLENGTTCLSNKINKQTLTAEQYMETISRKKLIDNVYDALEGLQDNLEKDYSFCEIAINKSSRTDSL